MRSRRGGVETEVEGRRGRWGKGGRIWTAPGMGRAALCCATGPTRECCAAGPARVCQRRAATLRHAATLRRARLYPEMLDGTRIPTSPFSAQASWLNRGSLGACSGT